MFDTLDTLDTRVGQPLSALPDSLIKKCYRNAIRPTVKGLLFEKNHKKNQAVASYEAAKLRSSAVRVFTGVGGGVESDESWITGFRREVSEELVSCRITEHEAGCAVILAIGMVPTGRVGVSAKLQVIVGSPMKPRQFHNGNLVPTGRELRNLQIGSIAETVCRLGQSRQTKPAVASLYLLALSELREMCKR